MLSTGPQRSSAHATSALPNDVHITSYRPHPKTVIPTSALTTTYVDSELCGGDLCLVETLWRC